MTFDSLLVELKPHSWLKVFFQNAVAQIRKAKSIKQDTQKRASDDMRKDMNHTRQAQDKDQVGQKQEMWSPPHT